MKKSTRILLGASIALITAVSLQFTVGNRFDRYRWGHYGHRGCGGHWHNERGSDAGSAEQPAAPSDQQNPRPI